MNEFSNQIPSGFFAAELAGSRLRIRPYDEKLDITFIAEMFADPLIFTPLGFSGPVMSEEKIRSLKRCRNENSLSGDWTIFTNNEFDDFVGEVGISHIDFENGIIGVFATVGSKHPGKAYGREAVSVLINHIFNNLRIQRIRVETLTGNGKAISLAESLGFQLSGMLYLPPNPITGFKGGNGIILDLTPADFTPFIPYKNNH
ncbi:MAG: GNAT family N-acetyltransferase [bacterium]